MEAVVSFLERIGRAPQMSMEQLARAFEVADLESNQKSALQAHDENSLIRLLHGREDMRSVIFIEDPSLKPALRVDEGGSRRQ